MIRQKEIVRLTGQIGRSFTGRGDFLELVMTTLVAGGHLLLEDKPGVGKTTLARAIAGALDVSFGRIQFTPDTLPTDVTGVSVYDEKEKQFRYMPGPVMNQVLLADEINRTSPKTQSSLLEAMEEGQVTVDGCRHVLPSPFFVIATENPVEFSGTYPLPEAELDRFLMCLSIGYPDTDMAKHLMQMKLAEKEERETEPVLSGEEWKNLQEESKNVTVSSAVSDYIVRVCEATRNEELFSLGASPRAMLAMLRAVQAKAWINDRSYGTPDDVQELAIPVLSHRLILAPALRAKNETKDRTLTQMLHRIPVPLAGTKEGS